MISYAEAAQLAGLGARVMHPTNDRTCDRRQHSDSDSQFAFSGTKRNTHLRGSEAPKGFVKAIAHRVNSEHGIVACVGDGLSNGTAGAA